MLYNADERSRMQPSIIYAGLALATLMKSSQLELGITGRNRALWLRDAAQSNLEQSLNGQWIDLSLAEAAMVSSVASIFKAIVLLIVVADACSLRDLGSSSL